MLGLIPGIHCCFSFKSEFTAEYANRIRNIHQHQQESVQVYCTIFPDSVEEMQVSLRRGRSYQNHTMIVTFYGTSINRCHPRRTYSDRYVRLQEGRKSFPVARPGKSMTLYIQLIYFLDQKWPSGSSIGGLIVIVIFQKPLLYLCHS